MKKYIMIWISEDEKWYYYRETFNSSIFKNGYVDYCIVVNDNLIVDDDYNKNNIGKKFDSVYDISLWN